MSYLTACGMFFEDTRLGMAHERHCTECATEINFEDERYGCYDEWEDDEVNSR